MSIGRVVAMIALVVVGCASPGPAATPSAPPVTVGPSPWSSPDRPAATPTTASPGAEPPAASLAAEGGDPVVGQLGTYVWRDGGSDSPWLPGARLVVGSSEPLAVRLDPAIPVVSWTARSVPASADGPEGATALGEGTDAPAFAAPGAGAWTVEVHVVFADDLGNARYFWRLEVS
jgi:hypothetical protein